MSGRQSWMPSDDSLLAAASNAALYWTCKEDDPASDLRDLIEQAVEKALAERGCARGQNTTQFCAEAVDLQRKLSEQGARHKRQLVEARIEEIALYADSGDDVLDHLADLRAELTALDSEAK